MPSVQVLPFARKLMYFGAVAGFLCAAAYPERGLVCIAAAGACLVGACVAKALEGLVALLGA